MKMLGKYIILYFEIELDRKKFYLRRLLEDNNLRWEYTNSSKLNVWTKCDETYRNELKPSTLEGEYKNYMRTQKLERILNGEG